MTAQEARERAQAHYLWDYVERYVQRPDRNEAQEEMGNRAAQMMREEERNAH